MNHRTKYCPGMDSHISHLEGQIKDGSGDRFLVFLDTGAIIDFERQKKLWKRDNNQINMSDFYSNFLGRGFPVFINKRILQEVEKHAEGHTFNGYAEISEDTLAFAKHMYENYHSFMQQAVVGNERNIDDIRYDIHWANKLAFNDDHKKAAVDPMSRADRSLVAAAIWAKYAHVYPSGSLTGANIDQGYASTKISDPISQVIIISPDAHVRDTVDVLTDRHEANGLGFSDSVLFGYKGIKTIRSR